MNRFVIDTNIVIKWFSGERETKVMEARKLYDLLKNGEISFYSPSFLLVELINIYLNKKMVSKNEVRRIVETVLESGIEFVDFNYLKAKDLFETTSDVGITSYDALYLQLANEMECQLVSEDEKLLKASEQVIRIDEVKVGRKI